jgi:hypothetical protein
MAKEKFSKGYKVRVVKTDLNTIEIEHGKHLAAQSGSKRLPYVEIHHDSDEDKYHVTVWGRGKDGSPLSHAHDHPDHDEQTMDQGEFTQHVVKLHKNHPKLQPFPKEARIKTHPNGWVDLHVAHPEYKKKNP